jgi:hypothetical protein
VRIIAKGGGTDRRQPREPHRPAGGQKITNRNHQKRAGRQNDPGEDRCPTNRPRRTSTFLNSVPAAKSADRAGSSDASPSDSVTCHWFDTLLIWYPNRSRKPGNPATRDRSSAEPPCCSRQAHDDPRQTFPIRLADMELQIVFCIQNKPALMRDRFPLCRCLLYPRAEMPVIRTHGFTGPFMS